MQTGGGPPETELDTAAMPSRDVNRGMAKGAAWMVAMRLAIRSIGFVSTVILARLLLPADFGLVAMATLILGFIQVMSQFGFDTVLIQKQDAGRDYYDTAWTLSILRGLTTAAILALGAGAFADFFAEPRLVEIVYVLCFVALLGGFTNIGTVDFRKQMTFGRDFRYMVGIKLCTFVVTLTAAVALRSYWALVIGIAAGAVIQLALSYLLHPYRPRVSLSRWREIMNFSKWLLITNMLAFANNRGATFFIGKLVGAQAVGLYTVAYDISNMPTSELIAPIRRAILPGYAMLASDLPALRRSFVKMWATILMLGTPMAIGIWLVADPLVRVCLGANWLEAIPLLQVLAIYGLLTTCSTNSTPVYLALGKPGILTGLAAASVTVTLPLLYWGTVQAGIYGAAVAMTVAVGVWITGDLLLVTRLLGIPLVRLFATVWRTAGATAVMMAVVMALQSTVGTGDGDLAVNALRLALAVATGVATYIATHLLLWQLCSRPDGPEWLMLSALRFGFGRMRLAYPRPGL